MHHLQLLLDQRWGWFCVFVIQRKPAFPLQHEDTLQVAIKIRIFLRPLVPLRLVGWILRQRINFSAGHKAKCIKTQQDLVCLSLCVNEKNASTKNHLERTRDLEHSCTLWWMKLYQMSSFCENKTVTRLATISPPANGVSSNCASIPCVRTSVFYKMGGKAPLLCDPLYLESLLQIALTCAIVQR